MVPIAGAPLRLEVLTLSLKRNDNQALLDPGAVSNLHCLRLVEILGVKVESTTMKIIVANATTSETLKIAKEVLFL